MKKMKMIAPFCIWASSREQNFPKGRQTPLPLHPYACAGGQGDSVPCPPPIEGGEKMREEGKKEEEREGGERKGEESGKKEGKRKRRKKGRKLMNLGSREERCGNGGRRGSCCGRIQSFNRYGYIILNAQNVTSTTFRRCSLMRWWIIYTSMK